MICMIGATELLLIAGVVLLIFGGKKLPELMKGMGQGVRSFKQGLNEDPKPTDEESQNARTETEATPNAEVNENGGNYTPE